MVDRLHLRHRGIRSFCLILFLTAFGTVQLFGIEPEAAEAKNSDSENEETADSSSQEKKNKQAAAALRPPFKILRYQEDWSRLRELSTRTGYDALKFIPLNSSESMYLSIGGQLRLRGESWWDFGFGGPGNRTDVFGQSRVRLHADLHMGPRFRVFAEGKSSLTTNRDLPGGLRTLDVDTIALQNAFVDVRIAMDPVAVTLRPGRQELQYGKQRLVSPLNWSNTRRTWDGVRGIVQKNSWRFDGFWTQYAAVQKYSFNCSGDSGIDFYGIYGTGKLASTGLSLDVYWLGFEKNRAQFGDISGKENRQTIGALSSGLIQDSGADYEVEAAYQFGDLEGADISAFMFTAQAGYTFSSVRTKPRIYSNLDFATGDDDPSDDSVGTFNQLFPLGHAYLGYIDMVGRQNIIDWSGGLALNPAQKWRFTAAGHYFWRQNSNDALYNPGGRIVRAGDAGSSKNVGFEVDFTLGYTVNRFVNMTGGYAHFFPGAFIEESGSSKAIDFLYFIVQVTF